MAETKTEKKIEREYVIPLRRFWQNVPDYERSGKAIKTIKKFIAKHMKIYDRDLDKIKLDVHMNNEVWFRGRASPPSKIKVKAIKENGIVKVELAELPEFLKFHKARVEKRHQKAEKKQEIAPAQAQTPETKTEEQKKDEKEKEKATADANTKLADQQAKVQKHTSKVKEESYHRVALKK